MTQISLQYKRLRERSQGPRPPEEWIYSLPFALFQGGEVLGDIGLNDTVHNFLGINVFIQNTASSEG